jgi:hypothetical protein
VGDSIPYYSTVTRTCQGLFLVNFGPGGNVDDRRDFGHDPVAKLLLEPVNQTEAPDIGTMPALDHFGLVGFPKPTIRAIDQDLVGLGLAISSTEVGKGEESIFERLVRHAPIITHCRWNARGSRKKRKKSFLLDTVSPCPA